MQTLRKKDLLLMKSITSICTNNVIDFIYILTLFLCQVIF